MPTFIQTLTAHPAAATTPAPRRRLRLPGSALAAAMIVVAPGRARRASIEPRSVVGRPDGRTSGDQLVLRAPDALALTRRSRCSAVVVRGGHGTAQVASYRGSIDACDAPAVTVSDASARVVLTDSRVRTDLALLDARRADVRLVARNQRLTGDVTADARSTVTIDLRDGSSLTGAVDADRRARAVTVCLDASSYWSLAGTSHVTRVAGLDVCGDVVRNICGNGRSVRYAREHNLALAGATLRLVGGGTLRPE